jgi:membrane protein DedA with SNARE-associated domain
MGRYGRRSLEANALGRRILRPEHLAVADRWFARYGDASVLVGRLLPVVRTFISLPAGLARMPPVRFGIYTVLGCIPWTAALAWTGYLVGKNWGNVVSALHGPSYVLAGLLGLLVIFTFIMLLRRRRRERGEHPGPGKPTGPGAPADPGKQRQHGEHAGHGQRARQLNR